MQQKTLDPRTLGVESVVSFHALRGLVTVEAVESTPAGICEDAPFHWNGTELVICSTGPASWPDLEADPVDISLVAGTLRFQFHGEGSTDNVPGASPEYREQLVAYLGNDEGHAAADALGNGITTRLFIKPNWQSEYADR